MSRSLPPILLLALAAPAAAALDDETRLAQLVIRERVIIRVPRMAAPAVAKPGRAPLPPARPIAWREKKGPKCIPAQGMAGAMVAAPKQVDLVLLGGQRVRAKLERSCGPIDFYAGFYLRPAADGMICADRDSLRLRSGASCGIDEFKTLVPGK